MILETPRLMLRPIVTEDAEDLYACCRGTEVGPNAGWKPHASLEETIQVMRQTFLGQEGVFGIVLKGSGRLIGSVGLIPDPKRENGRARMLGYSLGQDHWGQGYMTEAVSALVGYGFDGMGLSLISAYCYPHNRRSMRVLEKCGFLHEGILHQSHQRYDGQVLDEECFVLLHP